MSKTVLQAREYGLVRHSTFNIVKLGGLLAREWGQRNESSLSHGFFIPLPPFLCHFEVQLTKRH
jgi:hypothetical protein